MKYYFIYITCKNKDDSKKIGHELVKSRLAACVNIIDKMTSIYWWNKGVHYDEETVLIAKTKDKLVEKLVSKVKEIHTYTCPCIIALPIEKGNKDYLEWINKETLK